jgi:lysophospholipase L1-like esterase
MASDVRDLVKDIDPKNTVVVIQVLDNSTYYCGNDFGEMSLPKKGKDNKYHVDGELKYVKKQLLRELFTQILELVKAAGDCQVVITLPLPRWLLYSFCGDPSHCTNRGEDSFSANMNQALKDIRLWLEDFLSLRKLGNVHLFDPCPALGLTGPDMDVDYAMELWGLDPIHPTQNGYAALAASLTSFCQETIAEAQAAAEVKSAHGAATQWPKPVRREA